MAVNFLARGEVRDGPQPFDPARHMRQVAELVSTVFADELDTRGRGALREMQLVGRLSPYLGDTLSLALFNDFISGQVWMEGGRLVGNVTLQAVDQAGARWRISNVAVLPSHRRRGIAETLMLATLREVAQRGGNWAVLQVRADNDAAHDLYLKLGFEDVGREGIYVLPFFPQSLPEPAAPVEPLRTLTGAEMLELARAARAPLSQWADPVRSEDYRLGPGRLLGEALGRWTGLHRVERWAVWEGDRLMGAVETTSSAGSEQATMRFAVRPQARGRLEQSLVGRGLRTLAQGGAGPVVVQHDGDHTEGVGALRAVGFRVQRDLITMRRAVRPGDGSL